MAFNSLGVYSATHKVWDHAGHLIPVVEHSEGIRPHGEFRPAAWLPVQFYDKHLEEWFVVMPGKLLAFDIQGRVVPAQYGLALANVTYTQDDVDAGVVDVRTGVALVDGDEGTFAVSGVTDMMGTGVTLTVSAPVGVAPYPFWQWAGDGSASDDGNNPMYYRKHNYNLQHRTAILCDYVLELPLVPAKTTTEVINESANASNVSTFTLTNGPVAKNTQRTRMVFANSTRSDVTTRFVNEVENASDVAALGDWHIDLVTKVLSVYATATLAPTPYTVTYYNYASAPTGSSVSKFACALGDLKAGDFVQCNADSNWIEADPASVNFDKIMGQVLEVENLQGKDYLDRVRTAFDPAIGTSATGTLPGTLGQLDQMPGTATGGVPDKVHYAGAANLVVRVNLISR